MSKNWQDQKEKNSTFFLRALLICSTVLGRKGVTPILWIIALFYYLISPDARRASFDYLRRVGVNPVAFNIIKHFYTFARVSVDRIYILKGKTHIFDTDIIGGQSVIDEFSEGAGLFFVSHVGSFEMLRILGEMSKQFDLYILLNIRHNAKALDIIRETNPEMASKIIDAGLPGAQLAITIQQKIAEGAYVGIMVDRKLQDDRTVDIEFLNGEAKVPTTPWVLASVLKVPIYSCFGLFTGKKPLRYFLWQTL